MDLVRYILGRLLGTVPVLLVVSMISFGIVALVPGDPAMEFAGPNASEEDLAKVRESLGFDKPLPEQIALYYERLFSGDLGQSVFLNRPVCEAIAERLPVTFALTGLALLIGMCAGIPLGVLAAVHRNSLMDRVAMVIALIGLSIPDFWLGLALIYVFAVYFGLLPSGGYVPFDQDPLGWVASMTLPALALGITQIGVIARMTRASLLDVLGQDYVRTARAKGASPVRVVLKHSLTNAAIPIVTVLGLIVGLLLGGAVVVEQVFSLPGVGRLIVGAIQRRDYPVIQGGLLFTALVFVVVNIIVDVVYAVIDPRIRLRQ